MVMIKCILVPSLAVISFLFLLLVDNYYYRKHFNEMVLKKKKKTTKEKLIFELKDGVVKRGE